MGEVGNIGQRSFMSPRSQLEMRLVVVLFAMLVDGSAPKKRLSRCLQSGYYSTNLT